MTTENHYEQITKEQAILINDSGAWEKLTVEERARFQIVQERLCMPFAEFHSAVSETLDAAVFNHQLATMRDELIAALLKDGDPPSVEYVLGLVDA